MPRSVSNEVWSPSCRCAVQADLRTERERAAEQQAGHRRGQHAAGDVVPVPPQDEGEAERDHDQRPESEHVDDGGRVGLDVGDGGDGAAEREEEHSPVEVRVLDSHGHHLDGRRAVSGTRLV